MVVDDEAILRSLYSEILTAAGHEVVCVDSGRKAVELAGTGGFDLLFLDITLAGEWDGIEVFKRVRATNEAIKIILSTGSVEHAHIQPYIDQADAFLQKPFTMNDLLPLVDSL
jgi:CheY-like chemotaxis protein